MVFLYDIDTYYPDILKVDFFCGVPILLMEILRWNIGNKNPKDANKIDKKYFFKENYEFFSINLKSQINFAPLHDGETVAFRNFQGP